ncbi:sigma-54-dependent transcriptional regulator [Megalodesulfovibrio paquesii]
MTVDTTAPPTRLLVVEDERIARENLVHALGRTLGPEGHVVDAAADGPAAMTLLQEQVYDVVLTDLCLCGAPRGSNGEPDGEEHMDGMAVLEAVRSLSPDAEVIMLTGYATVETAVEAMNRGAYHYLAKPYKLDELRAIVRKALEKNALRRELRLLRQARAGDAAPLIVGRSPAMQRVRQQIAMAGPADATVLILGETGTGKELAARAIHEASPRRSQRFLAVNCAAFTETLLTSELFGHEKDAFTGARSMKKGLFEQAEGGTLFLDEIGDMPLPMQAQLLRVLEERVVMRVGGSREIPVDVRIVAATNRNLKACVEEKTFRQDLFYRLNVICVQLPALADRREDIELLATHFLHKHAPRMQKKVEAISREVLDIFYQYAFPGNVRELENIIESSLVMCSEDELRVIHLPVDLQQQSPWLRRVTASPDGPMTLVEVERQHIRWVLEQAGGNKSRAAQILGIDRVSLWRKLKRYGLEPGGED